MTEHTAGASALRSLLEKVARAPVGEPALRPGQLIGRYELVRVLGEGGFGVVYEAHDRQLDRPVALKVLRDGTEDDPRRFEWFEREARAMARLAHPHIVALHDFGEHEGRPYLVLELLHGTTLADVLGQGAIAPDRAVAIGLAIARALDHAHRAGVIHLDLKPSNVFIGDGDHVTVLDFGLARLSPRAPQLTTTGAPSSTAGLRGAGTPAFMAPEQEHGRADARTDVFAAGLLLYAMLTGELPFALSAASVDRVLRPAEPALRAVVPPLSDALIQVIVRALAEDPAARFADGGALVDALREAPIGGHRRSRRWIWVAAASAVVAAGVAIAWVAHGHHATGTWQVIVPARSVWTDTAIDVAASQTLHVRATGEVCTKPHESCAGPDGQARITSYVLPGLESVGLGALVGRIGTHAFAIGADRTVEVPESGRLWLGVNDREGTDNGGTGFEVTIELR